MNLAILADLRGVIPQVEHVGTPKDDHGVPESKGEETKNIKRLQRREHQEHQEHRIIHITPIYRNPYPMGTPEARAESLRAIEKARKNG